MIPTLLLSAQLIDGLDTTPRQADILVDGGRIVAIAEEISPPAGARVIDLAGAWVTPGLIDAHVHLTITSGSIFREDTPELAREIREHQLRALLAAGVTTALDCSSDPQVRASLIDQTGPRILWLGEAIGPVGGYPSVVIEDIAPLVSLADIPALLDAAVEAGQAGIKLTVEQGFGHDRWPLFSDALFSALTEGAAARQLPVYVHAMGVEEYPRALALNPHALVHSPEAPDRELTQAIVAQDPYVVTTVGLADAVIRPYRDLDPDLAALAHPVVLAGVQDAEMTRDSRHFMATALRPGFPTWLVDFPGGASTMAWYELRKALQAMTLLHEAGATLVMGTDAPTWPAFHAQVPGHATLRELELLEQAGLSPAEVLVAATRTPARMLGLEEEIGTLAVGRRADLVVLGANPLESSSAWRERRYVMIAGEIRTPDAWLAP